MKRVIYSLYIDIPENELDYQRPYPGDTISKTLRTKQLFKKHYMSLFRSKSEYAYKTGCDLKIYEYDSDFVKFKDRFKKYKDITAYEIVNFYKIHLMYELGKTYDEILYLDFDVVPVTTENFFDVWDLTKGICVKQNNDKVTLNKPVSKLKNISTRDPTSKYFNTSAMLVHNNKSHKNDVINTGIVGINKYHLDKLNYFENFDETLNLMTQLKSDYDLFPKNIVDSFGYDNETIFSFKLKMNNTNVQWLDELWHFFHYKPSFIPSQAKFIHVIDKDFDKIWRLYES